MSVTSFQQRWLACYVASISVLAIFHDTSSGKPSLKPLGLSSSVLLWGVHNSEYGAVACIWLYRNVYEYVATYSTKPQAIEKVCTYADMYSQPCTFDSCPDSQPHHVCAVVTGIDLIIRIADSQPSKHSLVYWIAGFRAGFFVGGGKQSIIGNTMREVQCP